MKIKKLGIILVCSLIITSLLLGGTAYAQDEELPDPGLTPDSPFYFVDTLGKNVGLFFAFGPEAKARKALKYAEERLAEARAMAARDRVKEMTRATSDYDKFMATLNQWTEQARQRGASDNVTERVALATAKHLQVLDKIKERLPEKAAEAIAHAREVSRNGQINALRALARTRPERAIEISSAVIEDRLERARAKATENITPDAEEALDYAARIAEIEEEMVSFAEEKGIDITAIQKRLAQSTSNRLEVLSGVYGKAPDRARPAIEKAIENSVNKYERAVEKLREKNALDEIPEEAAALTAARAEIKEKIRARVAAVAKAPENETEGAEAEGKAAREIIAGTQAKLTKIRAEFRAKGVTLTADAMARFDSLLAEAKRAFAAGDYPEAKKFAEQAGAILNDTEAIEKLEKEGTEIEKTSRQIKGNTTLPMVSERNS